ncbi:flagellar hook protein FlgE [Roseateles sp. YR242]|uniref:flagellar basal-body rod protein FlgF n=1 Tax=Roseateles sp. YR242 TaxID=1855305 RepID=UPI0008B599BB|nr:flagellar basal-body rod protein FlgF [Roseateles sp. YR242]SEK92904.1 flagellar hook protein FlgE [Roseateles sp. YR242]
MLDTIYVGMSGLMSYSNGLRVIANNTANLNTPGFKGSSLQFADMFYSNSESSGGQTFGQGQVGYGVTTYATSMNFKQGELRKTGNDLDLAVDGTGFFVLRNAEGQIQYTRAGQFEFSPQGVLVNRSDGSEVMSSDGAGGFTNISLDQFRTNDAKATQTLSFQGNLPSTTTNAQTVSNIKVYDASGADHTLTLSATRTGTNWALKLMDGTTTVGSGTLEFADGKPTDATAKISITYKPTGQPDMPLVLDFSGEVRSFASGDVSTLALSKQDGYTAGSLSAATIDGTGTLVLSYTNQQTVKGGQIALARFDSADAAIAVGDNQFQARDPSAWHIGVADGKTFGVIRSGEIELSNVDLSQQFSDLVIMQRGYQASSQVVTTANEMLQQLFQMKSK